MFKSKKLIISMLFICIIFGGIIGYYTGFYNGKYGEWTSSENSPMPIVKIGKKKIHAIRGAFNWCQKPPFLGDTKCTITETALPTQLKDTEYIKVKGNQKIDATLLKSERKNLRALDLRIFNPSTYKDTDSLYTPTQKGKYIYEIHIKWGHEQGVATYFFFIEVE